MNSVISAFKPKKNSSQNVSLASQNGVSGANDGNKHNNLSMITSTLSTSSSKKKAAINAQDNSYQYLRHIREIDTATKLLSPVVMPDDLLETDMLNFRPASVTPIPVTPAAGVDVVDHVPLQTVRLTPPLDTGNTADCNMNSGKMLSSIICPASLENGNESSSEEHCASPGNGQHSMANSPTQHLMDGEDDESEHSTANCTSTTSSSSSSDQSNSTVVHSPIAPTAAAAASASSSSTQQHVSPAHPSPAKSLNLSLSSSTSQSLSSSISVSSISTNSLALLNSGPSSCSSSATGGDISSSNDYSQPPSPTMVTRNSSASSEYVPAFLKSSNVTLPIIMPNSSSSLASLPPNQQTPANSATTTPKHTRYSKPRLSLSRFINHSMPSVHGRPNLSIPGSAAGGQNGAAGANGANPPKRASTHQRNLSLDFRSMGILLPPVSQVTNTRINLTQHHRNRSLDSALQRIPEVEVSSPNAESENTFCTPSILGSTMCSKIVTTAANVTAALTTTQTPALTSSTTNALAGPNTALAPHSAACAGVDNAMDIVSTTEPTSTMVATQASLAAAANAGAVTPQQNNINSSVIVEPYCPTARLRPKSSDSATSSSSSTVQRAASSASTASTSSSFTSGSNNVLAVINGPGGINANGGKKREDLTSLGSDDSGIICGSDSDQISLNRIRHSHESLDSGEMDNEEECIDMLETNSMDEEYNMMQTDLCFYQSLETDCRTLRPSKKNKGNKKLDNINDKLNTEIMPPDTKADAEALSERQRYRDMNMSQAAMSLEKCKISSDATAEIASDTVDCPTPTQTSNSSLMASSKTPSTPVESSKNDILFKNFFGATKNAIFRTAQSIIENHEKKNASKQTQKSIEDSGSVGSSTQTEHIKSPTDISKKKEFFGLLSTNASKKAAMAAAAAAAANTSANNSPATTPLAQNASCPADHVTNQSSNSEKSSNDRDSLSSAESIEKTLSLQVPNTASALSTVAPFSTSNSSISKSSSISSLNKLKVPGVVKCFIKERPNNLQDSANQQKTEKGPSGLLRFFESPVFNIHFAIHYLFYSKEPGVLSFIGNKIFSFPDQEVDLYIPQLIVMYIQMDELAEVLDPYLTIRCRKSVDFSLKCLWLLEAYNYQHNDSMGSRKSQLALMKEIYSKKERKQLTKTETKDQGGTSHNNVVSPLAKKTHHRSQSDATVLLADSRRNTSSLSIANRLYQQPPYTTQTLPATPAKLCLGDLTSGRAFDNGCTCFETVRGQVNDLLGHKTVCSCNAPKTAPQKEFMKALMNVGKNLTNLPSKAEKTSALRMFLNLINKNLPARVWLPLYSDIPHHVVRITEEKTAVLNSKDKTPYIIYVEVVEVPDIYSSSLIPKMMPSLRHTKSEEHLEVAGGGGSCQHNHSQHLQHATCSRTSSCSSHNSCRRKKEKPLSESSSTDNKAEALEQNQTSGGGIGSLLSPPQLNEDDVWSQEDDEITAQYLHMRKMRANSERDAISQMSLDSCDSRDQGMPVLFNIGDVRTRHCNNLNCENTKSFSNDPEDPSAAALKEPWDEKVKQIRESSPYGHLSNWRLLSAIVKCGDDLRQELMATQLLQMFKIIWQEEHVDLWVRPYKIVCLSNDSGLIEPILNTVSLHQIKKNSNKSLRDYFIDEYGPADSDAFRIAQKNFVQSCAAYCLISYLLQVKDRHNGNILLHSDGHIIHIDFGFILSISPKNLGFEQSPFKLTPEFVEVMGGTNTEHWREFNRLLLVGMMTARKHMDRIINFVEIMRSNAQLPCFKNGCSGTVQNLRKRFHMNLTEQEMERKVEQLVQDSLKSLSTKLYDGYQYYTNGIL
ncbi:serine-rich adhesin for platelets [Musca vetustissima]|uniref:serine-rich adhesin for platelets n=1 Tax=Musca vetustissima TaxID=27455 RepID=UPI002AB7C4A7|nr:serine-rich adhesin for platelets [Musca vetustissima]